MSYSFTAKALTKDDAKTAVAAKFDEVIAGQPVHAKDREAALAAASSFIDLLVDPPEGQQYSVSVSGSVGWRSGAEDEITGAGVNVSASLIAVE